MRIARLPDGQGGAQSFFIFFKRKEKFMLTHVVIFRTRNADKVQLIRDGVETLRAIDGVKFFHCGVPNPSERPVVDDFFDVAIVVAFENGEEGLKRYATHPVHVNFVENYLKPAGGKLLVYDITDEK